MPLNEIHETLGKESPFYSTVKKWTAGLKRVRETVEDDEMSGCPKGATADENAKVVHTLVMCDRRRDLQTIASEVGIGLINPNQHLIYRYVKGFARWVPRMLTNDQKTNRLSF